MEPKARIRAVARALADLIPEPRCELDYRNPWELLVATILSAQCTDQRVNQVTPGLFGRWPGPSELAHAPLGQVEDVIRPTGFFRNKAKALTGLARRLVEQHDGKVPTTVEELVAMPGVGRKTANVVLGEAFGIPAGIAVDTHVKRVSRRLGLTDEATPEKIESDLEAALPLEEWPSFSMRLILHGRSVCSARKPRCSDCQLEPLCLKVGV